MKKLLYFVLALSLLLAACSKRSESNPPTTPDFTRVTLALDFGLGTLGLPFGEDGTPVVESLDITILDSDGDALIFDDDYNIDPDGGVSSIPYIPGDSVTVGLIAGEDYTFQRKASTGRQRPCG